KPTLGEHDAAAVLSNENTVVSSGEVALPESAVADDATLINEDAIGDLDGGILDSSVSLKSFKGAHPEKEPVLDLDETLAADFDDITDAGEVVEEPIDEIADVTADDEIIAEEMPGDATVAMDRAKTMGDEPIAAGDDVDIDEILAGGEIDSGVIEEVADVEET